MSLRRQERNFTGLLAIDLYGLVEKDG